MIKKLTILCLLFFAGKICISQVLDCNRFHQGKFRIADTRTGVISIADRNSMYQTESSETLKATVRFKISWQDNCSYTLKIDQVIRNENKINFPPDMELHIKIIHISDNGYIQQTTSSLVSGSYNVAVSKIN